MKWIKKIAELFSKSEKPAQSQPTTVAPTTSKDRACVVVKVGETEYPLFIPQILLSWYTMYKTRQTLEPTVGHISQVLILDLFDPLSSEYQATTFAIKDDNSFFWGEIGTRTVYQSAEDAFIYRPTQNFRILLKRCAKKNIIGVCHYKDGEVIVDTLLWSALTPPTDTDAEQIINCPLVPCNLKKAADFAERLTS